MSNYEIAPGIDGYRAAQEDSRRNSLVGIQGLQGIMGIQNMMQEQQLLPLKLQQLQASIAQQQFQQNMLKRIMDRRGDNTQAVNAMGEGANQGDVGPTNSNAARIPSMPGAGGLPQMHPDIEAALFSGHPGAEKWAAANLKQMEPINVRPGGTVYIPGQGPQFTAPNGANQTTWQGGIPTMGTMAGALPALGAQAAAESGGKAAGAAPFNMSTVNTPGAPTLMTQQQQIEAATGQPMPRPGMPNLPPPTALPQRGPGPDISGPLAQLRQNFPAQAAQGDQMRARDGLPQGGGNPNVPTSAVVAPGLRLQDQQEGARETKFGAELAQLQREAPQARASVADISSGLDRLKAAAQEIKDSPSLSNITGTMGVFPNMPGSAAADLSAKLNSLKSQVGFSVLQAMREASKTGGALGAISDKENELLQNNITALDRQQSVEGMKKSIQTLIDYADGAKARLNRGYLDNYERVIGNQGMTPSNRGAESSPSVPAAPQNQGPIRTYNPKTGKIE